MLLLITSATVRGEYESFLPNIFAARFGPVGIVAGVYYLVAKIQPVAGPRNHQCDAHPAGDRHRAGRHSPFRLADLDRFPIRSIRSGILPRLFQPFARLASPLQSTVPGTGLGLYLSRKPAAEVLKGDILLNSEYGRGEPVFLADPGEDAMEKVLVVEGDKESLSHVTYATKRQCHGVNGGEINEYSHCR
jgi:hypothetical protein